HLRNEVRVPAHLVGAHAMGLEPVAPQEIGHAAARQADFLREQARRPAAAARRRGRHGQLNHPLARRSGDGLVPSPPPPPGTPPVSNRPPTPRPAPARQPRAARPPPRRRHSTAPHTRAGSPEPSQPPAPRGSPTRAAASPSAPPPSAAAPCHIGRTGVILI